MVVITERGILSFFHQIILLVTSLRRDPICLSCYEFSLSFVKEQCQRRIRYSLKRFSIICIKQYVKYPVSIYCIVPNLTSNRSPFHYVVRNKLDPDIRRYGTVYGYTTPLLRICVSRVSTTPTLSSTSHPLDVVSCVL